MKTVTLRVLAESTDDAIDHVRTQAALVNVNVTYVHHVGLVGQYVYEVDAELTPQAAKARA